MIKLTIEAIELLRYQLKDINDNVVTFLLFYIIKISYTKKVKITDYDMFS